MSPFSFASILLTSWTLKPFVELKDSFDYPINEIVYYKANDSISNVVTSYNIDSIKSSINNSIKFKSGNYLGGPNLDPFHVPVKIWIVKGPNGVYYGNIFGMVNDVMRGMNENSQNLQIPLGITFYLEDFEMISDKTSLYDISKAQKDDDDILKELTDDYRKKGCFNVFIVNDIAEIAGRSSFPANNKKDYSLVMDVIQLTSETFLHEIGHSFNLTHTHGISNKKPNEDRLKPLQEAATKDRIYGLEDLPTGALRGDFIIDTYGSPMVTNLPESNFNNQRFK